MQTFICAHCGVQFSRNKKAKYCSSNCSGLARMSGKVVPCKTCGTSVYLPKCRVERGTKENFCSKECHDSWQSRGKVSLTCKVCEKEFLVSPTFSDRKYCSIACRDLCPDFKRDCWLKNNIDLQKRKPTGLEIAGRAILDAIGLEYTEQVLIGGKFAVDVVINGKAIVIQWDGDYWHGFKAANSNVAPDRRVAKRMALDRSQDAYMAAAGLTVLRFWEHEVFARTDAVRDRIIAATGEFFPAEDEARQAPPPAGEIPDHDIF